jgi:hypothetical protein
MTRKQLIHLCRGGVSMRSRTVVAFVACLAVLMVTAIATAGGPVKFPVPAGPLDSTVGDPLAYCSNVSFTGDPVRANSFGLDFGTFILGAGGQTYNFTNTATGGSMQVNITGPGKFVFGETTVDIYGSGHWLIGISAIDPAALAGAGPSFTLYTGQIHIHFDPVNGTQILEYNGSPPVDMCAAIAAV